MALNERIEGRTPWVELVEEPARVVGQEHRVRGHVNQRLTGRRLVPHKDGRVQAFKTDQPQCISLFFWRNVWIGGIIGFVSYVLYSTLLHLPPLRFHCVGGMLGSYAGLLRLRHWQSEALTTRLDLIHNVFSCFILFFIRQIIPRGKSLSTMSYLKEQCHEIFVVLFLNHLLTPDNPTIAILNFVRKFLKIFVD